MHLHNWFWRCARSAMLRHRLFAVVFAMPQLHDDSNRTSLKTISTSASIKSHKIQQTRFSRADGIIHRHTHPHEITKSIYSWGTHRHSYSLKSVKIALTSQIHGEWADGERDGKHGFENLLGNCHIVVSDVVVESARHLTAPNAVASLQHLYWIKIIFSAPSFNDMTLHSIVHGVI